jgi:hypothetical protein
MGLRVFEFEFPYGRHIHRDTEIYSIAVYSGVYPILSHSRFGLCKACVSLHGYLSSSQLRVQ